MDKLPNGYKFKDSYEFKCALCNKSQRLQVSLMMQMGVNTGAGRCLYCKEYLHLWLDYNKNIGMSEPYQEFVDKIAKEKR